jgi:Mg2+ and Co2+ transporter CorA
MECLFSINEMNIMIKRFTKRRESIDLKNKEMKINENFLENLDIELLEKKELEEENQLYENYFKEMRSIINLMDLLIIDMNSFLKIVSIHSVFEKKKF